MTKKSGLIKALDGLKSVRLTAAQEFRIKEQREIYDAVIVNRANQPR